MNIAHSQITKKNLITCFRRKFLILKKICYYILCCLLLPFDHMHHILTSNTILGSLTFITIMMIFNCKGLYAPKKLLIYPRYVYRCVFCLWSKQTSICSNSVISFNSLFPLSIQFHVTMSFLIIIGFSTSFVFFTIIFVYFAYF